MKKKLIPVLSLALAASIALSACAGGGFSSSGSSAAPGASTAPAASKILRVNTQAEPGSLHPGLVQGTHESWIVFNSFEGLYKREESGELIPAMASKSTVSADGLEYVFTLKDNLKWSNGDPLTATDFEFAWKYALDPETKSRYASILYYVKGAEDYNTGKGSVDAVGVKAVDDKTLKVTLAKPTPFFLDVTTHYTYFPVSKKNQQANPDWAKDPKKYVSNGPFVVTSWKQNDSIEISRNVNYYEASKVKLDGVKFNIVNDSKTGLSMYQSGTLDLDFNAPSDTVAQMLEQKNPEVTVTPALTNYYYTFNTTKKPFDNAKVRQALSMSIDRETIVKNVMKIGQTAAYGMTVPGVMLGGSDFQKTLGPQFSYDPTKAKQLLAEGLKESGMDKLSFTILYNTDENHKKIAQAIQEMWRQSLGIEVTLENTEFKTVLDRRKAHNFDVVRAGWVGDYVDPDTFLNLFTSGAESLANTGFMDPKYDKMIEDAGKELDVAKRVKMLQDAERYAIAEKMVVAPIYFDNMRYLLKPYVKGVFTVVNRYPMFAHTDIVK